MSGDQVYFAGISTGGSAVRRVFPAWAELLGIDATLECIDIPAGAPPETFQDFVLRVRNDPTILGAIITAHKTSIFEHASSLFDVVEPLGRQFEEISVIFKDRANRSAQGVENGPRSPAAMHGTIIEPESIATTLTEMGNGEPFVDPHRDVVVYGAGGTAVSLIAKLTSDSWPDEYRPRRLVLIDTSEERLALARAHARSAPHPIVTETFCSSGVSSLGELGELPDGSLIINATGLGKDRPGSPVALPAPWPFGGHIWDLNYRGELLMLESARAMPAVRELTVHDGWQLFINGWAASLEQIVGRSISTIDRQRMDDLASEVRKR